MTPALLLLPVMVLAPVAVAALVLPARTRRAATALAPWTPLAALAAAVLVPDGATLRLPAVLLGTTLALDTMGRLFLGVSALVWLAAGAHRRPAGGWVAGAAEVRRTVFFLLSQAGSLGALATMEPVPFYLFFAVATVAAYGMIAAGATLAGRAAGRLYLAIALFGELLALAAFMLFAAGQAPGLAAVLLLFGLGNKLGLLPLHLALAPAYAAMPAAATAAFAGPVLNAAVYGLLRFLPLAGPALPDLTGLLVVLGLATAFTGGLLALLQDDPKALLGYSTVSQMGILTTGLAAAPLAPAVILFALLHAVTKAALVLGTDAGRRGPVPLAVLVLPALSLAALPPAGGALAKAWLEEGASALPEPWAGVLHVGLPLTSTATALYMARFLWLVARKAPARGVPVAPFLALAATALAGPWIVAVAWRAAADAPAMMMAHAWTLVWPVVLGTVLAVAGWRAGVSLPRLPDVDPDALRPSGSTAARFPPAIGRRPRRAGLWARVVAVEARLRTQRMLGLVFFAMLALMAVLAHA
ncbi:MAG TPA: proton-conducting transporter membrane subunit [Azospirillum sp.]|nr:proton-conducting transporter membrane subunit [Azospirillum sp.]